MKTTLSEQLILGILAEESRHGYDIEKLISERGVRKWADIGFSSIYYVLDKLEAKGLIVSEPAQGKEKKQYTITSNGIAELKAAAKNLVVQRKPANTAFMTGLAVSDFLSTADLAEALGQRRIELAADLKALCDKKSQLLRTPPAAQRLFSLSETLLEAELRWVNEELERIDS